MRLTFALFIAAAIALGQTRRDDFDPSSVEVSTAQLSPLEDGGCSVRFCGSITSDDGGVTLRACTQDVDITNATQRTRCTTLLSAGGPRVLRELRFAVDAGGL